MPELSLPRGVLTPMITPFRKDAVDELKLQTLIERQVSAGVHGIILCDQMGEGLMLNEDERHHVLTCALDAAEDRVPVVAAVFSSGTSKTIDMIAAVPEGVSAVLVTMPFYSKPTSKGIVRHFHQIAEATKLPIIIDDDPKRTAKALTWEVLEELRHSDNIRGVRHCSGDVTGFVTMPPALRRRFRHYAGDDRTALGYLMAGASSISSPIANLFPALVCSFFDLFRVHTMCGENAVHERLHHAITALGPMEPPTLKHALSRLGVCEEDVRLPLVSVDDDEAETIAAIMAHYLAHSTHRKSLSTGHREFL